MSASSAGRLYRIVSFDRAVQIFGSRELHFAHPSTWEDPYEVRLQHGASHNYSDSAGVPEVFQTLCGGFTPPIICEFKFLPVQKNSKRP